MKKILCCFVSVLLLLSSSPAVFAKGNEENRGKSKENPQTSFEQSSSESAKNGKYLHKNNELKNDLPQKDASDKKPSIVDSDTKQKIKDKIKEKRKSHDNSVPVFIKDKEVKFDVPPVIKYGRTLIPVRAITNALGADVEWDAETKTVTVSKAVYDSVYGVSTTVVTLKLDSDTILVNGKEAKIDVPAQLVNNRTMVPIRFIAQALNQEIEYDSETGAIIVEEDKEADVDIDIQLKAFKDKLKDKHHDKFARKALTKMISELNKKKNNLAIMVFIKGSEVEFDVPPVIKSGRTLIPVRAVSGALGADVDWDPETKTITITKSVYGQDEKVIKINLDSDIVLVNGEEVKLDVPAQSINNRTMVPLRFIAVVLDKDVEYDSQTGTITIEDTSNEDESFTDDNDFDEDNKNNDDADTSNDNKDE